MVKSHQELVLLYYHLYQIHMDKTIRMNKDVLLYKYFSRGLSTYVIYVYMNIPQISMSAFLVCSLLFVNNIAYNKYITTLSIFI